MPIAQTRLETLQVCKLLQCVREKDKESIEKMTLHGVPHLVNYNDPNDGLTALGVAATSNDDDMIRFLLLLGAHPDVMDFKGRSAAMRAAEYGHVECLVELCKNGANMKLTDLEGKGILFYCITPTERHSKCLEIAVENGADINNISKEGIPVLMFACETASENEDTCILMMEKGAEPNAKQEKTGKNALMAAAASGSVKVVRAILEAGGDVNAIDIKHGHAAHYACQSGNLLVLACMAGYGAQFDQYNSDNNNPIHLSALHGHGMFCKFLAQRGCNPKPKNNDGDVPKNIAKDKDNKEAMKECRKAEKSFGKVGKNNELWAIQLYDWVYEKQKKLLDRFQAFDTEDSGKIMKESFSDVLQGMSAPVEEEDMKKLVLAHDKAHDGNVDYNDFIGAKKWVNKNYLMSAFEGKKKKKKGGKKGGKKKGKFKLVMPVCVKDDGPRTYGGGPPEMFIERHINFTDTGRFDRDKPPHHPLQDDSSWYLQHPERMYINVTDATKNGDFDSLRTAFQKGSHVDTRDKYYKTPLMCACSAGNLEMVKFLLENGANINARDNFKWTPLHHACHSGQLNVVEFLIEHGAEIDATTMNGGTPLTRAIESSKENVVAYLISRGVRVQTENKKGHNPMDLALAWADPRVIDVVQTKWESMPTPSDKKGGKGKGGKGKGGAKTARPASGPGGDQKENQAPASQNPYGTRDFEDGPPRQRKGSILRAASALAQGLDEQEDITYIPLRAWVPQPTTEDLLGEKQKKRDQFTWEVDFDDFQMPFNKNISNRCKAMENEDD
ncbi:Ankyrin repeat and EF-hand domain-containing protein 1 [Mytilus edulis]|uniref:Ankyrin repeat and EF-hand domain-containing protein 1 n=1 Tax=Mytilus edulis TaxID=6550 RepID=A0A8S3RQC4_MYTED|nr:Ankyrin repeat and EF-hand domain-containing protein 1 [Mytilus edulis]